MRERERYLEIGKIVTTQGLKGEVRVLPYTEDPEELLDYPVLYLGQQGQSPLHIAGGYVKKNVVVVKFEEFDTIDTASPYIGKTLYFDREDEELPDGEYYITDLIGCRVLDVNTGRYYGDLIDITNYGSKDIYWVQKEGKTVLVPNAPGVICKKDPDKGEILIAPLKGLFEDEN